MTIEINMKENENLEKNPEKVLNTKNKIEY